MSDAKLSPCHIWGDEDFDWAALDEAAYYLQHNCRKWARLGIWTKEKYGTLRVSTTCAFATEYDFLHSLIYPGHAWIRWPTWFRVYVDWPLGKVLGWLGIVYLTRKYQMWILKKFWLRAADKWPQCREEILDEYEDYFND